MSRDRRKADEMHVGSAWYTRETWDQLRERADDRDALDDTFENWERQVVSAFRELESIGPRFDSAGRARSTSRNCFGRPRDVNSTLGMSTPRRTRPPDRAA